MKVPKSCFYKVLFKIDRKKTIMIYRKISNTAHLFSVRGITRLSQSLERLDAFCHSVFPKTNSSPALRRSLL